ncbi:DUF1801 domain-containing protein [Streptomyces bohaiensis]|uniref:DUF1801 domain-containing protein n=1 Tax=Streptomyces bohaiensis TaxID=1431344 RepID=A0ABX1CA33_9ACTN|nr:DUF1801 domain-containing protein [Streptomyces bohaiensis]NJQ14107.1 DUF1801 domain-containing protein [Streptomyces bohaiensis]
MGGSVDPAQGTGGFSSEERAALQQRAAELKAEAERPRGGKAAAQELEVLAKIAEMPPADRAVAERFHAVVTTHAPDLAPKLWYGQPAYARRGTVVCFFRSGDADKERYSTVGFTTAAALDDESGLWPTSYAVTELSEAAVAELTELVRRAVG